MKHTPILLLTALLAPAAAKVYTGFNYGAFWGQQSNVKRYDDFRHGFELAKNLTTTPVSFDSARLYTCITAGTKDDPTEAFQAAIDTGTNLLLGMWVSPGATGQSNEILVDNELAALGKALEKHGQKLADLVIGLSIGNEDIYRFNSKQIGVGPDNILLTIQSVRNKIAAAPWAKFMQGKPIGHTDTPMYAVVPGSDFIGMTAYPYWEGQSINNANATFMSTLKDTQRRAGNTSVWISEVGWPINGTEIKDAVASADNYQRYWDEVGCQLFGKYNTFWFELLQDSMPDQPDWGLLDTKTYKPRIEDLSCRGKRNVAVPLSGSILNTSLSKSEPALSTLPDTVLTSRILVSSSLLASKTVASVSQTRTIHTTETRTTTIHPTSPASGEAVKEFTVFLTTTTYVSAVPTSNPTLTPTNSTDSDEKITACIVMMDPMGDGIFVPVVTYALNVSTCSPPPQFTGSPFTMIAGPTPAPNSTEQRSSFDLWAPVTATTASQSISPVCVTSAGATYEAVVVGGQTYTGRPTASCAYNEPEASHSHTPPVAATLPLANPSPNPPTSISATSAASSLPKTLYLTTFLTIPTPPSSPALPLAPTTSAPTTPSPFPPVQPTQPTKPPCPEHATVCTTVLPNEGWLATIVNGDAHIIRFRDGPARCEGEGACTWGRAAARTTARATAAGRGMVEVDLMGTGR